MTESAVDRFTSHLSSSDRGCWIWTGPTNAGGYGSLRVGGRKHFAHRWSYEYHVAPIPEGLVIDHLCRNPSCVNPWHLEPVTHQVNMLRGEAPASMWARQTQCRKGHPFDDENTIIKGNGCRGCRECRRIKERLRPRRPDARVGRKRTYPVRERERARATDPRAAPCPKCGAAPFEPCRVIATGRAAQTHQGRVDAA